MRSKLLAILVILGLTGSFLGACEEPGIDDDVEIEPDAGTEEVTPEEPPVEGE